MLSHVISTLLMTSKMSCSFLPPKKRTYRLISQVYTNNPITLLSPLLLPTRNKKIYHISLTIVFSKRSNIIILLFDLT